MDGRLASAKAKPTITVSREVLAEVDCEVERKLSNTRSNVIEIWLRCAGLARARDEPEMATIAYYEKLSEEARVENEEWSRWFPRTIAARRSARSVSAEGSHWPYSTDGNR